MESGPDGAEIFKSPQGRHGPFFTPEEPPVLADK